MDIRIQSLKKEKEHLSFKRSMITEAEIQNLKDIYKFEINYFNEIKYTQLIKRLHHFLKLIVALFKTQKFIKE
jgi:hypothetical protein